MTPKLGGSAAVNIYAANHKNAVKWYADFLEMEPYFKVPGYSEFRVGDYQNELGIVDSKYAPKNISDKPAGSTIYWHVDNLQATFDKIISLAATVHEPITARGNSGFVTASVVTRLGTSWAL
jgi:predicted enzyme related to lactoylglutathione lyase